MGARREPRSERKWTAGVFDDLLTLQPYSLNMGNSAGFYMKLYQTL